VGPEHQRQGPDRRTLPGRTRRFPRPGHVRDSYLPAKTQCRLASSATA
jgi:hypothetical protein